MTPPRPRAAGGAARTIRIGAGAGFSGDRLEPAVELAESGDLDYIVFECLAERTIALAQDRRMDDPEAGYDPMLEERMDAVLPACAARGTRIVSNMGAANPRAAARKVLDVARRHGLAGMRVAAVLGDDVVADLDRGSSRLVERDGTVASLGDRVVSANAYLGAEGIAEALAGGADVVLTGRVGDPALFLAPMVHEFGWAMDDWDRLAQGTLVGHLLECAGQLTGGYFADPGFKDVPGLARLGFPLAEIAADGSAVLTKVAGSGGRIGIASCREQLVYEVLDPARYIQPDVVADFTEVAFAELAPDRIAVSGARGLPRPERLKVSVGYRDGYVGEGQISYAGPGAVARGRLALDIVAERFRITGLPLVETRFDLIGVNAVIPEGCVPPAAPSEVRARVVGRARTMEAALAVGNEVEALYTNGPAGGGGVTKTARRVTAIASTFVDRGAVRPSVVMATA